MVASVPSVGQLDSRCDVVAGPTGGVLRRDARVLVGPAGGHGADERQRDHGGADRPHASSPRSAVAARSTAARPSSSIVAIPKKPWIWPSYRTASTSTPASREPGRVGLALVAERVELGGDDQRLRQARRASRRGAATPRVLRVEAVAQVVAR